MSTNFDLHAFLSSALEKELVASHHEVEVARLRESLTVEDRERVVVVGIQ
jgi:hypothetical protein